MKIKTQDLTGPALDLAVARALYGYEFKQPLPFFNPSVEWNQGGPLIEGEGISLEWSGWGGDEQWIACLKHDDEFKGPTPLVAAMRCYVASRLGDEVEIPEELK